MRRRSGSGDLDLQLVAPVVDDQGVEGAEHVHADEQGGPAVQLQLSDGKRLTFDKTGIALDDGHGNTISIEGGTGRITIEAASSIALRAPQISIESSSSLELKSSGRLTLQGSIININ